MGFAGLCSERSGGDAQRVSNKVALSANCRSRNALLPPFRFERDAESLSVLLAWALVQCETKCPDFTISLGKRRAQPPRIHSAPERNRTINGLAAAAASAGPASGKRDLRKAKRPVSLPAAGRNASQGYLSTMARKKSTLFLALVVRTLSAMLDLLGRLRQVGGTEGDALSGLAARRCPGLGGRRRWPRSLKKFRNGRILEDGVASIFLLASII